MHIRILCSTIILLFSAYCARTEDSTRCHSSVVWRNPTNIRKVFDTPGGEVYQFPLSLPFAKFIPYLRQHNKTRQLFHKNPQCQCEECLLRYDFFSLQATVPEKFRKMRFIGIEFQIRQFPAMQANHNGTLHFALSHSNTPQIDRDLARIQGTLETGISPISLFYSTEFPSGLATLDETRQFSPAFAWTSCRILFDTATQNILIWSNGIQSMIRIPPPQKVPHYAITCLALSITADQEHPAPVLIELSKPTFFAYNRPEELREYPIVRGQLYPYEHYSALPPDSTNRRALKKYQDRKNPDFLYAQAMRLLYRPPYGDPRDAVELLEKASRKGHVFAQEELGICYANGIGVRQDLPQSHKTFARAKAHGSDNAASLAALAALKARENPVFLASATGELLKAWQKDAGYGHAGMLIRETISSGAVINGDDLSLYCYWKSAKLWSSNHLRFDVHSAPAALHPENAEGVGLWFCRDLKNFMAQNYPPAFLAYGKMLIHAAWLCPERREEFTRSALTTWQKGAEQGDFPCRYSAWLLKGQLNTLSPRDFTPETDIQGMDQPGYHLLKHAIKQPDSAWTKSFFQQQYAAAEKRLQALPESPEQKFLRGLLLIVPYYQPGSEGLGKVLQRILPAKDTNPTVAWTAAIDGFRLIEEAAEGGTAPAQYLAGVLHLTVPEETVEPLPWNRQKEKGEKLLKALPAAEWPLAGYYLAQYYFENQRGNQKVADFEKLLQPAGQRQFAPAWLLLGKIYEQARLSAKAETAYCKAGALGEPLGYSFAATLRDREKRDSKSLWAAFMPLSLKAREQNRLDPYSPQIELLLKALPFPPKPEQNTSNTNRPPKTNRVN